MCMNVKTPLTTAAPVDFLQVCWDGNQGGSLTPPTHDIIWLTNVTYVRFKEKGPEDKVTTSYGCDLMNQWYMDPYKLGIC